MFAFILALTAAFPFSAASPTSPPLSNSAALSSSLALSHGISSSAALALSHRILSSAALALSPSLSIIAPQNQASFQKDLDQLHRYIEQRNWKKADRSLKDFMVKYEKSDRVFASRAILLEDAQKIAFWAKADIPDIKGLISGELKSYKPGKTAKIKLVYQTGEFQDFERSRSGDLYHPLRFDGPFTVRLEGQNYPWRNPPSLTFGDGDDEARPYQVTFGTEAGDRYYPARIFRWDGEDYKELDSLDSIPAKADKPFAIEVKVTGKKISVKLQKKTILETKLAKDAAFGTFYLGGFADANLTMISMEGEIQTSWLDNLLDDAMQEQRRKFEANYSPTDNLPMWLFAEPEEQLVDPGVNRRTPAPQPVHLHRAWRQVEMAIKRGRTADAVAWLEELDEEDLPISHRAYLLSQLHFQMGDNDLALEQCRLVLEEDPFFLPSRMDEAWFLYRVDRAASFDVMLAAAEDFPNTISPSQDYLTLLMMEGRLNQAKDYVDGIATDRPRSPVLDTLTSMLVKAENGPYFTKATEYSTEHYVVRTDMDREICIEAAKLLERMYRAYRLHLKGLPEKGKQKFSVFLFSGESGFQRYAEDVLGGGHASAAGLYSSVVKQLLIWNLPERDEMFRTVQHEGFHQYLDRMMPDPPVWFNEGAASYYELAGYTKGKWAEGQIDPNAVARLRDQGMMPLKDYIRLGHQEFRTEDLELRNYAQGWLLTHFWRNTSKANLKLFEHLFAELCEANDGQRCVNDVFANVDLEKMDREFRAHLAGM